jgi:hypothetical protein
MKRLNSYITRPNNNCLMLITASMLDSSYTCTFIKHKLHCKEQILHNSLLTLNSGSKNERI